MHRLIEADPHNREAIVPYIGGEEVNTSPTHAHHRYVINFRDYPLRREDLGETWRYAAAEPRREWIRGGIVVTAHPPASGFEFPRWRATALSRKELRGHWRAQSAPILVVLCQM